MKRMLSILLCLTLLIGVSGFPAAAADTLNVNDYYVLPESVTVDGVTITPNGQIVVSDEKLLQVLGDINANIPDYGTALSVMDGGNVDIGGSVIRNIGPDTYGYTIVAGSWSSEGARPSYVRVGKNVQGDISAYAGSSVDIQGYAEGNLYASGEGTSVSIDEDVKGEINAYSKAAVSVHGDVVNKVKAIQDDYVNYATSIIARNGATVTIDGSISAINSNGTLGTGIDAYSYSWNDEVPEGSTVEVSGNVQGQIRANYGSTIDIKGHAEGGINASGKDTSVYIGDYVKDYIDAYGGSTVDVKGHTEGRINASGEGTSVSIGDYVKGYIDAYRGSTVDVKGYAEGDVNARGEGTSVSIGDYVKGYIDAYYGSTIDIKGHAEGNVDASGDGTSVTIGDYVKGQVGASDHATVSVNGDVTNKAKPYEDGYKRYATGVTAENGGNVTVNGNVSAINSDGSIGTGIDAQAWSWNDETPDSSTVEVSGNVQGQIRANYGTTIDIKGHAEGGVSASGEGTEVSIGDYVQGYVGASGGATVDVKDYVEGGINAQGEGTSVFIGDYVKGYIDAYNGSTVDVKGHAEGGVDAWGKGTTVTIGDGVKYESATPYYFSHSAVSASDHATVSITGDVISKVKAIEDDYVRRATGIIARNGATVTVDGNVSAINSDGSLGTGIDAYFYSWNDEVPEGSTVEVTGDVQGQIRANYGSTVKVQGHAEGGIEASGEGTSVTIGDGVKYGSDELPYYTSGSAVSPTNHTVVHIITSDSAVDANNRATVTVNGDVVSNPTPYKDGYVYHAYGVTASNGAAVTVDGNVTAINSDGSLGTGVFAEAYSWANEVSEGSTIDVTGDVTGIVNSNGSVVDIRGHVNGTVLASGEGAKVTIGDGITASGAQGTVPVAIDANDHAEVSVTGDVDGLGVIHAYRDATVTVDGNVSLIDVYLGGKVDVSGNAKQIYAGNRSISSVLPGGTDHGGTVRVGGDVSDGVFISMYSDGTDQSKVTVEGTINSKRDVITLNIQPHIVMDTPPPSQPWKGNYPDDAAYQKAMENYWQALEDYWAHERELFQQARNEMNSAEGLQTIIDNLPQIIVGTLAPETDFVLVNGIMNQDNQKKITEALLSQINYIVNMEGVDTANIAVYGYEELDGYLVAREQQKLTVKCINDNMVIAMVSAGRYATVEANGDGSYTITVQRGGDLNLVVTAKPKTPNVPENPPEDGNSPVDEALWGGWLSNLKADYAKRILILDLTDVLTTDIPYETLRAYMVNYGIDTLIVITENAEYTMSIAEVLALAEDGATYTFSAREGALELAVDGSIVSTFSVE